MIWGNEDVHGPFIMEQSGDLLWNQVELARVVDGSDNGAPTVRNTIRHLANYILENSKVFVRDGRMTNIEEVEVEVRASEICATGEALLQLAAESREPQVTYEKVENPSGRGCIR